MTVKDLIERLSDISLNKEVVFYNLNGSDLEGKELETILDFDEHIEITIKDIENDN